MKRQRHLQAKWDSHHRKIAFVFLSHFEQRVVWLRWCYCCCCCCIDRYRKTSYCSLFSLMLTHFQRCEVVVCFCARFITLLHPQRVQNFLSIFFGCCSYNLFDMIINHWITVLVKSFLFVAFFVLRIAAALENAMTCHDTVFGWMFIACFHSMNIKCAYFIIWNAN